MKRHRTGLLLVYLALIPLAKVTLGGIPLPELFFPLLLAGFAAKRELRQAVLRTRLDALDGAAGALIATAVFSWWMNYPTASPRDVLILIYLAGLYRLTRYEASRLPDPDRFLRRAMIVLGAVLVLSGLGSWGYYGLATPPTFEVIEPKYFPGGGFWPRLEGLTMSPNLFFNLCQLPLLVLFASAMIDRDRRYLGLGLLLLVVAGTTLSKSLPLLVAGLVGLAVWSGWLRGRMRYLGWGLGVAALLLFLVGPKVILLRDSQPDRQRVTEQSYFAGDTLGRLGPYTVYASTHWALNQQALGAFAQRPLWGHGPGSFRAYLAGQQERGHYPTRLPRYDPHQLYLGTLAETGLLGLAALLFWLWQLGKTALGRVDPRVAAGYVGLVAYLVLWLLEGWHMDTLHFRQFWWVAGIVAGLSDAAPAAAPADPEKPGAPSPSPGTKSPGP